MTDFDYPDPSKDWVMPTPETIMCDCPTCTPSCSNVVVADGIECPQCASGDHVTEAVE